MKKRGDPGGTGPCGFPWMAAKHLNKYIASGVDVVILSTHHSSGMMVLFFSAQPLLGITSAEESCLTQHHTSLPEPSKPNDWSRWGIEALPSCPNPEGSEGSSHLQSSLWGWLRPSLDLRDCSPSPSAWWCFTSFPSPGVDRRNMSQSASCTLIPSQNLLPSRFNLWQCSPPPIKMHLWF